MFAIHPGFVTGERPIGLAWFSPDCKHHSKAKGGKPRDQKIRGLAWVTLKWATFQAPRCIALENVEEFLDWGPLDWRREPDQIGEGSHFPGIYRRADEWPAEGSPRCAGNLRNARRRLPHGPAAYRPGIQSRVGESCVPAILGTPTIRKRLYVFARRDGLPIVWPTPTHGDPKSEAVKTGKLLAVANRCGVHRLSIPCPSIFERKRPLKDATLRRIAKGIMKFVVNAADPFIVKFSENSTGQTGDEPLHTVMAGAPRFGVIEPFLVRTAHSDLSPSGVKRWGCRRAFRAEPLPTVTASQDFAIVAPTLMHVTHHGSDRNGSVTGPSDPTVTGAHRGEQALVTAHITKMRTGSVGSDLGDPLHTGDSGRRAGATGNRQRDGHRRRPTLVKQNFGETPCQDAAAPLHTITTQGNKFGVVAATLIQTGYGERPGQEPRAPGLDKPLGTAVAGGVKHAVVSAFLAKHYGGVVGTGVDVPTGTVTTSDHHSVVTAQLVGCGGRAGQSRPRDVSEPAATITSKADTTVVTSHLLKLRNNQSARTFATRCRRLRPVVATSGKCALCCRSITAPTPSVL